MPTAQLTYYVDTATASRVPTAEGFTVADGRIVASVLVFDRLAFSPPNQPARIHSRYRSPVSGSAYLPT
jgi:hypothetical protein